VTTITAPVAPLATTAAPVFVTVSWLVSNLDNVRVIDTRRTSDYLDAHVPGAINFPLDALLIEDSSHDALERLGLAAQVTLGARGVAATDHIVLVDDGDGSAALGATICELAGVENVSILRGTVSTWQRAGAQIEHVPTMLAHIEWDTVPVQLSGVATFEALDDALITGTAQVLDTRSQLEHEGIVGASCCRVRGALPGCFHLEWTALTDMSGELHTPERTAEILAHVGINAAAPIIVTCHAGHRAAVAAHL
jgi:thiosulfate/3-mercaptopyruvate sulfurtransferase